MRRRWFALLVVATTCTAAACSSGGRSVTGPADGASSSTGSESAAVGSSTTPPATEPAKNAVQLTPPTGAAVVVDGADPATLAVKTSQALFTAAPAVVVAGAGPTDATTAAQAAAALGVPVLIAGDPPTLAAEVQRLGARTVLTVGVVPSDMLAGIGSSVKVTTDQAKVPSVAKAAPATGLVALVNRGDPTTAVAAASAQAVGATVVAVDGGDPRAAADSREALRRLAPQQVIAIGQTGTFPAADVLDGLVRTVLDGIELPGGGQVLFPGRRLVALYGHPGDTNLGVLGEQPVGPAVQRAQQLAAQYQGLDDQVVIPTFEVITTVASSSAGADGDYSLESSLDLIQPWVDAAAKAGMYVVLDLQPGFTDFLTQAKRYESLLIQPNVGLSLDPEWRLAPGQKHLRDIGHVNADEVNSVITWLADLTRTHALPQKLLLLQQFRNSMLPDRAAIVNNRPELALVVQMDGLGPQSVKLDTYSVITQGGPAGMRFGWKNFYDEDKPTRSPADTVALKPSPVFVSYQ